MMPLDQLENRSTKSYEYWDNRYIIGADSGPGSYNQLAEFKAYVLNKFVETHEVQRVLEFGCGDGNQLLFANYGSYFGLDVSKTAIQICKTKFATDASKSFCHYNIDEASRLSNFLSADLVLSLDVLYHLVEDEIFESYIDNLFKTSTRFVIIYSSNFEDPEYTPEQFKHVRHRKIADYIENNIKDFEFIGEIKNVYPQLTTANFYIYQKI